MKSKQKTKTKQFVTIALQLETRAGDRLDQWWAEPEAKVAIKKIKFYCV